MKTLHSLTLVFVVLTFYLNSVKLDPSRSLPKGKFSSGSITKGKSFSETIPNGKSSSGIVPKGKLCIDNCQCPNGTVCLPTGNARRMKRCQKCECRLADQCVKLTNNSVICDCSDSGYTGVFCETKIEENTCPNGWIAIENSLYCVVDELLDWATAKAYCESKGAYLAEAGSVDTLPIFALIYSYIDFTESHWFGLTDKNTEGFFYWYLSGVEISPIIYNFDPRDNNEEADCGFLYYYTFYVDQCDSSRKFVCERDM